MLPGIISPHPFTDKEILIMEKYFYCAANAIREEGGGIQIFSSENMEADDFPVMVSFIPMERPSYMAFSRDRRFFYVVGAEKDRNGYAAVFAVEEEGKVLRFLAKAATKGISSCHLTTSPDDEFLYCANYVTGTCTEFKLKDGIFEGEGRVIEDKGVLGPAKPRQEHAHAHCTVFTPDGKYLCVVDLGTDSVFLYSHTPGKGIDSTPSFEYKETPGEGPRHLVFAKDGIHAYLLNELGNTLSTLIYKDGTLVRTANISTIPSDFKRFSKASAIRFSPDEKLLVATNRGHESFACFEVKEDHTPVLREIIPSCGSSPRDMNFLPGGKMIGVCHEFTHQTVFFPYDAEKMEVGALKTVQTCPGSLCLIF